LTATFSVCQPNTRPVRTLLHGNQSD
jgi:hypothetical protein